MDGKFAGLLRAAWLGMALVCAMAVQAQQPVQGESFGRSHDCIVLKSLVLGKRAYLPQESFIPATLLNTGVPSPWSFKSATKYPCLSN